MRALVQLELVLVAVVGSAELNSAAAHLHVLLLMLNPFAEALVDELELDWFAPVRLGLVFVYVGYQRFV